MVYTPTSLLSLRMPFWSIVAMLKSRAGAEADSDRHTQAADTEGHVERSQTFGSDFTARKVEKSCGSG